MVPGRKVYLVIAACAVAGAGAWLFRREPTPTFARDIASIVLERCASCHHPGEAAPFSLLSYDDVKRRARQIADVTQKRFMPPWLPNPQHSDFVAARWLSDQELRTIQRWVDAGAPLGEPSELPAPPAFADRWIKEPPDLVIETPAYTLASQDRDVFRNFVVPVKLESPRWIQSIEVRPENPRVTHHARLGVDASSESRRRDGEGGQPGYAGMSWAQDPEGQLVIWAPGVTPTPNKSGVAWRLYPHTSLVLHTHMQPSGKPEVVRFRVGIRFAKDAPQQHPVLLRIGSCNIDIPAGVKNHVVTDQFTLPIDVDVHTIFPHAHSLCKQMRVIAERPDGTKTPLIAIDRFDENWHDSYRYRTPVRLPRGARLVSTFTYDNSDENVRNRNHPARRVVYGSSVTDEMADVYLQVTAVRSDQRAVLMEDYKHYDLQSQAAGFRKSLELDPDNPWSQEGLATCQFGLGDHKSAVATLERRLKAGPPAIFPIVSMGMALAAQGDMARAEAEHRKAIAIDEKYPLAWFGLGRALAAQGHAETAEQALRRAIELSPGLLDARMTLADLLIRRGQLDDAKAVCTAALGDAPDLANLYLKLAEINAKQKNYEECLSWCRKAQLAAPYTHTPKVLLAVFCHANGNAEGGAKLLQEALIESPTHPMPALILGQLARQQNQLQRAQDLFSTAMQLPMPDNWPASHQKRFGVLLHSERFKLAQQLQDRELARSAVAEWLKYEPDNRQLRTMAEELGR